MSTNYTRAQDAYDRELPDDLPEVEPVLSVWRSFRQPQQQQTQHQTSAEESKKETNNV